MSGQARRGKGRDISRREAVGGMAAVLCPGVISRCAAALRVMTFAADVTPPLGHALMGGGIAPAKAVGDRLEARGIILSGPAMGQPVVLLSIDWCEIRNDAYQRWREVLAGAAKTSPERVLVSSVHVHDAPIADLRAEWYLDQHGGGASVCDPEFHARAVEAVAEAARGAGATARVVSQVGYGQAQVEQVASNRRYLTPEGVPTFGRMSATRDAYARAQPEGVIDPWLRSLSFWDGDRAVAVLSHYATHPMSYYGRGVVSADFVGMARRARGKADPSVFPVYFSGCSGNVVAGKYNDGSVENRPVLARRLARAMGEAWERTQRSPIPQEVGFQSVPLRLEPRTDQGFRRDELMKRLQGDERSFGRCLAALGLSWLDRVEAGRALDVPVLDFGAVRWMLLPAESYVEYQLAAQAAAGAVPVCVAGYGECGPGYIPTDRHIEEGDTNLSDWCWVARGSEGRMREAILRALG